ncbi:MAG: DUF4157 domain-containing protein [Polyangiales bacterium]
MSPQVQRDLSKLEGAGRPLTPAEAAPASHGADFSQVRIHTDAQAQRLARALHACAFTYGRNVGFARGAFRPETAPGRLLLAHELSHAAEQRAMGLADAAAGASGLAPVQLAEEGGPDDTRTPEPAHDGSTPSESRGEESGGGLCLRTPFPPGQLRFVGCSPTFLSDVAVMPESGTTLTHPARNGVWYDADGFWFRHHAPRSEWFKVPGHCTTDILERGSSFAAESCCNLAASVFKGRPRWTSDGHGTANPF